VTNRQSFFLEKIQQTQMTTPTKDALLALLKRKELNDLVGALEKGKTTFEEMLGFSKADWKEIAGTANGIAIYNHLHPNQGKQRGSAIMTTNCVIFPSFLKKFK